MFIPVISDWARKIGVSPSRLFIPLSYAAVLGGMCTLIGTSTNLVVQGLLLADPQLRPMGFWTVGAVGAPAMVLGLSLILIAGRWLLKDRTPASLATSNPREYTIEV